MKRFVLSGGNAPRRGRPIVTAIIVAGLTAVPTFAAWLFFILRLYLTQGGTLGGLGDAAQPVQGALFPIVFWLSASAGIVFVLAVARMVYKHFERDNS